MTHKDKFNRIWNFPKKELCKICGQSDNCGDCNHKKLDIKSVKFLKEK